MVGRWTEFTEGPEHAIRRLLFVSEIFAVEFLGNFSDLMCNMTVHSACAHGAHCTKCRSQCHGRTRTYVRQAEGGPRRQVHNMQSSGPSWVGYMKMTRLASKLHGHSPILNVRVWSHLRRCFSWKATNKPVGRLTGCKIKPYISETIWHKCLHVHICSLSQKLSLPHCWVPVAIRQVPPGDFPHPPPHTDNASRRQSVNTYYR